jgi:hypothetical protein
VFWTTFFTLGHVTSHLLLPLLFSVFPHHSPMLLEHGCTFSHALLPPSLRLAMLHFIQPTSLASKVVAVGVTHLLNTLSFQYWTYFVHVSSWCVIRGCDTGARKLILYTQTAYRQRRLVSPPSLSISKHVSYCIRNMLQVKPYTTLDLYIQPAIMLRGCILSGTVHVSCGQSDRGREAGFYALSDALFKIRSLCKSNLSYVFMKRSLIFHLP